MQAVVGQRLRIVPEGHVLGHAAMFEDAHHRRVTVVSGTALRISEVNEMVQRSASLAPVFVCSYQRENGQNLLKLNASRSIRVEDLPLGTVAEVIES